MLKEAIEKILSLGEHKQLKVEGDNRVFVDGKVVELAQPETIIVNTLTGLVDYVKTNIDNLDFKKYAVQVVSESEVVLFSVLHPDYRQRAIIVEANRDNHSQGFKFGQQHDAERFIIELQSHFDVTVDLTKVLRCAGSMKAERVSTADDDGITQTVATKAGVVLTASADVPNPVTLAPFRTFLEVMQPQSKFVFRVHQSRDSELPKCALYEADGGKWKLEAIASIKDYFAKELPGVAILA